MTDKKPIPVEAVPENTSVLTAPETDPANEHLAAALRKSFAVLSVIMIFLLVAYVFSGMVTVKSDERAVILRFGQLVGATPASRGHVLASGLHFCWPYPVDEVVRVPISKQSTTLESFWHFEKPGEAGKPEYEKVPAGEGLRPRFDGALITGDHGLVHVIWQCEYQISSKDSQLLDFVINVTTLDKAESLLASAIEDASIQAAATYPAEAISRNHTGFRDMVQRVAQAELDQLRTGVQITTLIGKHTPPLQTLKAFRGVTVANQQRDQTIETAMKMATETTRAVAGENWRKIADAIDQYELASDNPNEQARRLQGVMDLLHAENSSGEARKVIEDAEAYASQIVGQASQAYEQFSRLLETYKTHPDMVVSRLWMDTLEEVFASDMNIKLHVPRETGYILYPQLDPDILRGMERRKTEAIQEKVSRY